MLHITGDYKHLEQESISINGPLDSFGKLLVSQAQPLVISNFFYNVNTDLNDSTTAGTGSVSFSNQKIRLSTGTTTGSTATDQSHKIARYVPGTGIFCLMTPIFGTGVANTTQICGIGNSTDGFFFGYNGTAFSILRRSRSSNNWIAQTAWNGDKFNGSGKSKITIDPTKGNVYAIQVQWLGFGVIKFWIENPETGLMTLVHTIPFPNTSTLSSIGIPAFRTRMEVDNGSTTTDIVMDVSCVTIYSEGNTGKEIGLIKSIGFQASVSASTKTSIITIRNKSTFASLTNHVPVLLKLLTLATDGSKPISFELIKNPTVSGFTVWSDINTNTSVMEYSTQQVTISDGTTIMQVYEGKAVSDIVDLINYNIELGPGDTFTVTAFTTSGTNDNGCSLTWRELF